MLKTWFKKLLDWLNTVEEVDPNALTPMEETDRCAGSNFWL